MKSISIICSALAFVSTGVNAAVIGMACAVSLNRFVTNALSEKRQASNPATAFFASSGIARSAAVSNPVTSKVKPEFFSSATREKLVWGPYNLAPPNVCTFMLRSLLFRTSD
jgi:hypothetical protein